MNDEDESGPEPTGIICRVWPTGCAHPHLCQDACFDDDIVRERGAQEKEAKVMTRDRLEEAFLRLRAAGDADEYVPMEDVIEVVLQRFTGDLHLVSENSMLRAENAALRAEVAARLSFAAEIAGRQLPSEKVIPILLKLARHEEPVVREGALYGLSFHLDDEVVRTTISSISSSDTSEAVRSVADDLMDRIAATTHGASDLEKKP